MKLYHLQKTVFNFKRNAVEFLNGLTSNDMDKPHNAFLNSHGRIVATFDQIVLSEEEVIVVLESSFSESVLNHIEKYVKLAGVKIEELSRNVYFDLDGDITLDQNDYGIPQRMGRLMITEKKHEVNVSKEEFTLFRLKNDIPLHGLDYRDELLLNVDEKDFVSFTKGCYLGQEPISKVHSRSKPSWKLVVRHEDECSDQEKEKMTSNVLDPETQKTLGFVFIKN